MGTDSDAAREAFGMVPPGKLPGHEKRPDDATVAGPTSPAPPEGQDEQGPESGGYDNRPTMPTPDNRKGGYGAG